MHDSTITIPNGGSTFFKLSKIDKMDASDSISNLKSDHIREGNCMQNMITYSLDNLARDAQ